MPRNEPRPTWKEDLTKRHTSLFRGKWLLNPISLAYDAYESQKLPELASFLAWELLHRLRLFPRENYLKFNNDDHLTLRDGQTTDLDCGADLSHFFAPRQLRVESSPHNWKLIYTNDKGVFFGCLYPCDTDLYRSDDGGHSIVFLARLPGRIKAIFVSSCNTVFVCVKGSVYRSSDQGISFAKCLDLGSSESFFRYNNAMTETPGGALVIGEYGNVWEAGRWKPLAYLYHSSDDGESWESSDFLIKKGTNKHVHVVRYSRLWNRLLLADGDNQKKLWLSDSLDKMDIYRPNWKPVNRHHIQMGGYTSIVECNGTILLGTDYQGGTNFIVSSKDGKTFRKMIVPDPYRRSPIDNMICRRAKSGDEAWANLPFSTADSRSLLMYTTDSGLSWNRVIEYNRATHTVWLVSSSIKTVDHLHFAIEDARTHRRIVYRIADA